MKPAFEISGDSLAYLLYAVTLGALGVFLLSLVWTRDSFASTVLAVLLGSLVIATGVGLWREKTDREGEHLGTVEDIVYDPLDPGQAAKERWLKSVRLFSGGDDEEE